jgi:hypothetical protein
VADSSVRAGAGELERERDFARPAALAAFGAVALYLISYAIEQSSGLETEGMKSVQLESFNDSSGAMLVATIIRAIGFLLISVPLLHLFRAARLRSPRVRSEMIGFVFIGPVLFAIQSVLAWIATSRIADEFLDQRAGSAHPADLAQRLIDDSSLREVASAVLIPAVLALAVGLIYTSLWAMRTGLLTRFAGSLGIALGASMILIFPIALIVILFWLVYVGLLFIGRAPGGTPPAWEAGEAIPWPTPGEKAAAELESPSAEPAEAVERLDAGGERRKRKQRD